MDKDRVISLRSLIFYVFSFLLLQNIILVSFTNHSKLDTAFATDTNSIIAANDFAIKIALKEKLYPLEIARVLALLDVSIYDSLLQAQEERPNNYSVNNIVSGSTYVILTKLFPEYRDQITTKVIEFGNHPYSDKDKADWNFQLGNNIGNRHINFINISTDNTKNYTIPKGDCIWTGENPTLPFAGNWKTLILKSSKEFQVDKPFACGSTDDLKDVQESIQLTQNLSTAQIKSIHYWGDKPPPVIWNNILNEYIRKYNKNIFETAYASAYLNAGIYDALVSCWETKYTYWTDRPEQRTANLSTELPTPNFPGYTSAHSVVSVTASKILGEIFYNDKTYLDKIATEASLSRIWAGIHFKQDVVRGTEQGLEISAEIIADMHRPPHQFSQHHY